MFFNAYNNSGEEFLFFYSLISTALLSNCSYIVRPSVILAVVPYSETPPNKVQLTMVNTQYFLVSGISLVIVSPEGLSENANK